MSISVFFDFIKLNISDYSRTFMREIIIIIEFKFVETRFEFVDS